MLGGEPFLHPDLPQVVSIFRENASTTSLQILTGGIFKKDLLDRLSPDDFGMIFNINEPRDYKNPAQYSLVTSNVEAAIRRGFRVLLGFNVWREDFDPDFMPSLAHRLGRSSFRWTVANPQWRCNSNVLPPESHPIVAARSITMMKNAARRGMEALLDCPLPLCFFSESDLAWLRQFQPGSASRLGVCQPVIDVTPELEAIRCFALSKALRVKVTDFPGEWAIADWFQRHVDAQLLQAGYLPECASCEHFQSGHCTGGCLAWHKCSFQAESETPASRLARDMYAGIEAGEPAAALSRYRDAVQWLKSDLPSYLAAVAAVRTGNKDEAFRFACRALDITTDADLKKRILALLSEIRAGEQAPPPSNKSACTFIPFPGKARPDRST